MRVVWQANTSLKKYTSGISLIQYIQQTVNSIINYAIKFNKLLTLKNYVLIVYCKRQTIPNKKISNSKSYTTRLLQLITAISLLTITF